MGLIDFNKPKKIPNDYSFDGGPPGGFMPQMSDADARKWKGKRFNKGKVGDRIEIRKSFGNCQILIFVAKDGWVYSAKNEAVEPEYRLSNVSGKNFVSNKPTKGLNVRISMNGPLMLTFNDFDELIAVVEEAKTLLK